MSWDRDQERIELRLGLVSSSLETGLVFPTPGPAVVTAGDANTFSQLEALVAPKTVIDHDWWGDLGSGTTSGAAPEATAGAAPRPEAPVVLGRVQLGPIEATTLQANDSAGLTQWLTENDYQLADSVTALLSGYVDRGWYFVVVKITGEVVLTGGIDPIRFTFRTEQLVYPMALSRAATDPQFVRLYVFDGHRARPGPLDAPAIELRADTSATYWAGPTPVELADRGTFLTALNLTFEMPQFQIPGDLAIVQASDDSAFAQPDRHITEKVKFLGMPAGWAIILGVVLALIAFRVVLHVVRQRSDRLQE